ncbi:hypothetical protein QTN47_17070 [Danxiaibacter flavus]|uniref:Uncharacterized protein n=1 Tax=Danxiaibacter flavus TaxID=3049108 RepID=A0ABV3ZL89_9BACT|nr:hypothetical protein QNM32_17080 [Chitinophagaceae bacterium DXS]
MQCFKNYIGLDTPGAESGLSLISLPGITLDNFSKIKESNSQENQALWNDIQNRAIAKFATACMAKINECFRISDITIISCLVCEKKQLFATSFWYLLGAETMTERIYSDRVNRYTTIDKGEAQELQAYYNSQFESELASAVKGILPNDSDCVQTCVPCNSDIQWEVGII